MVPGPWRSFPAGGVPAGGIMVVMIPSHVGSSLWFLLVIFLDRTE